MPMNSEKGSRNSRRIRGHRRPAFFDFFLMNASLVWLRSMVGPCSVNGIVDAVAPEEFLLCPTWAIFMLDGTDPGDGGPGGISFTVSMLSDVDDESSVIAEGLVADRCLDMMLLRQSTNDENTVDRGLVMACRATSLVL